MTPAPARSQVRPSRWNTVRSTKAASWTAEENYGDPAKFSSAAG